LLTFSTSESAPLQITTSLTPPIVYLDHGVIANLAKTNPKQGVRFREALVSADGTLFISWAHIIELCSLGFGPTFQITADYLASFGGRFAIIDADPNSVIRREMVWRPGLQNPVLDQGFMRLLGGLWDGQTELSLRILFDAMVKEPDFFKQMNALHKSQKENLKTFFDLERSKCRTDKRAKRILDAARYVNSTPTFITQQVSLELMRETVRTNEQFNLSDGLDFYHAVVSTSYCSYVVLDRKWARRCRTVAVSRSATIFDGTQIEQLLAAINPVSK
jgi:hypothetical protein